MGSCAIKSSKKSENALKPRNRSQDFFYKVKMENKNAQNQNIKYRKVFKINNQAILEALSPSKCFHHGRRNHHENCHFEMNIRSPQFKEIRSLMSENLNQDQQKLEQIKSSNFLNQNYGNKQDNEYDELQIQKIESYSPKKFQ